MDQELCSSVLYNMRDSKEENNCGGGMKVDDVAENLSTMCENQAETTFTSPGKPGLGVGHIKLMGTLIDIESPNIESVGSTSEQGAEDDAATPTTLMIKEGASAAAYSQRYKDVMDALSKPVSSYALLYVAPTPKTPLKKETRKSTKVDKTKTERFTTKKEAEYKAFPQNVRTLTATGMLDGVEVRYRSASSKVIALIMSFLYMYIAPFPL